MVVMDTKQLYQLYQQHPCITTDSRDCPEGSIFLALKGESFNGNLFAVTALEKGCSYVIVDEVNEALERKGQEMAASRADSPIIRVDNCLQTFKDLAREHRRRFKIPVIGITGTNGKTTTKELIATVLSKKYNVLYTQGNFNNDVGVPKTLFRLSKEHEIAVIEMGASHPGDIRTLAETAEPTCGLITNVGRAHLQGFGSFKNVVKTKGELYDFLGRRGESLVFLNVDDERLVDILPDNVWVAPYSAQPENVEGCTCGEVVGCTPYLTFRWRESDSNLEERGQAPQWYEVQTQLIGAYNIHNLMAAIAVGLNFAVEPKDINDALVSYVPSNNRSQLMVTANNRLIVDAYNANPSSMRASLENFKLMDVKPKMVILGDMRELGNSSHKEHQKIVDLLGQMQVEQVWLVGDEFAAVDCPKEFRHFHDVDEVKEEIANDCPKNYHILIKGSNSTRLYQLPELL